MAETKEVAHRGYVAKQSSYNHHIVIYKDGKAICHMQCDRPKTKEELRDQIDNHIQLMSLLDID